MMVYLIKYIRYKNIKMKCGEPLYKKVACLQTLKKTCYFYFATRRLGALYTFKM